jgi:hypothetical protein
MNNNHIRHFDCADILGIDDDLISVTNINQLLNQELYFKNVPGFQTSVDLFKSDEVIWKKYKDSLIRSVNNYIQKKVKIVDISSWAYKSTADPTVSRNQLWHDHIFAEDDEVDATLPNRVAKGQKLLCGIYYLKISNLDDINTVGTEFSIEGNNFFIKPIKNSWFIFEPNLLHRSGITKHERYTIAADIIYETSN